MNKEQELQADEYYNELVKCKTITTLNEALVFKLAYEKALTMHDVGYSLPSKNDALNEMYSLFDESKSVVDDSEFAFGFKYCYEFIKDKLYGI